MNEDIPTTPATPSPLQALLDRLAAEKNKRKKATPGAYGKASLADVMAKKHANNPERVARREARKEERAKARAKRSDKKHTAI